MHEIIVWLKKLKIKINYIVGIGGTFRRAARRNDLIRNGLEWQTEV